MLATTFSSGVAVLVVAVCLAAAVEMVEALTIVVAVGHTQGWRSALQGTATALATLTVLVAVGGPALIHVPLTGLRLIVGGVLLIFGMQWLRKAVLRSSGLKAKHDEDAIYQETVDELRQSGAAGQRTAFVMAFKGVFLEGLEIVITVLTLGTSAHRLALAAWVASGTVAVIAIIGVAVARQLSSVPENAMKMTVGILLVSYGTFWVGEGLHVQWPGNDAFLLALAVLYGAVCAALVASIRVTSPTRRAL